MSWRTSGRAIALLAIILFSVPAPAAATDFDLSLLSEGGYVVLLRHVKAGGSDTDDFDLKNCKTQRQVGAPGRKQAAELSSRFVAAGVTGAKVLSSQFCRALQTAELLDLGPVIEEPALNYFHWRFGDEATMNRDLRTFLAGLEAGDPGTPLILVTHKHAFKAVGVEGVKSGGGVVLKPNGSVSPIVAGRITAP